MKMKNEVTVIHREVFEYPMPESLFRPSEQYPEYIFSEYSTKTNQVYDMVRESFRLLRLDEEHYGGANWNPLGKMINSGETVLIKPNMVMESNNIKENGTDCLYTNPAVVAAVVDYVLIALQGKGMIIIGDAPMQECKFDTLIQKSGYKKLVEWYQSKGVNIEIVDFRGLTSEVRNGLHIQHFSETATGRIIDLSNDSEFFDNQHSEKLRITNYDPKLLNRHHNGIVNEYYVSDYVLNADVIINMPKPKSHRKAGVTIAMKNLVGISVRKEFLPHHKLGSKEEGGDEYLKKDLIHKIESYVLDKMNIAQFNGNKTLAMFFRLIRGVAHRLPHQDAFAEGSWYGNETISKTICDLNKIVMYADKNGIMQHEQQRRIFIVADMIVSGEKEGPVAPTAKNVGIIAVGLDQVCFDEAISRIMGFDYKKIPTIMNAHSTKGRFRIGDEKIPKIISNDSRWNLKSIENISHQDSLQFEPTAGWKGHIEIK